MLILRKRNPLKFSLTANFFDQYIHLNKLRLNGAGLLIISAILFCSCNRNAAVKSKNSDSVLIDSIVLHNVGNFFGSLNFSHGVNAPIISYVSERRDMIYFVNYKVITDSLPLPPFLKNKKFNYFIDSAKMLFAHFNDENSIYKFKDTNLVTKYTYYSSSPVQIYLVSSFLKFEIINNTVLMHKVPNYRIFIDSERVKFFTSNLLSLFTLRNDSLVEKCNFSKFPKIYSTEFSNETYSYATRLNKDSVAYLFSKENNVYMYDFNTNTEAKHPLQNIGANILPAFKLDSMRYLSYTNKYELRCTKFLHILHDDISKKYIIIQSLKVPDGIDNAGYMPIFEDVPMQINILDSSFSATSSIYFKNQSPDLLFSKSYYFNSKLYVPQFSKSARTVIYVYKAG